MEEPSFGVGGITPDVSFGVLQNTVKKPLIIMKSGG
jgi:hypothetical protein